MSNCPSPVPFDPQALTYPPVSYRASRCARWCSRRRRRYCPAASHAMSVGRLKLSPCNAAPGVRRPAGSGARGSSVTRRPALRLSVLNNARQRIELDRPCQNRDPPSRCYPARLPARPARTGNRRSPCRSRGCKLPAGDEFEQARTAMREECATRPRSPFHRCAYRRGCCPSNPWPRPPLRRDRYWPAASGS